MARFWDKVKKGAQEAGEKAAQLAKIAKIQTEVTGLGSSRKEKILSLGEKAYNLYKSGKLGDEAQEELKTFIAAIEDVEKKVADKKKQIEKIKAEMNEKKEEVKEETEEVKETVKEEAKEADGEVTKEATEEESPKESEAKESDEEE